jgi:multidrug resistance efflux pump
MKSKTIVLTVSMTVVVLLVSACGGAATPTQGPASTQAPATDSSVIIAEGRLEPIRYADIAFTANGTISEVLVEEGQTVKKGDPLIRLGDESDTNYAAAQLELASAHKALNDLQNTGGTDLAQAVIDLKEATEDYNDAVDYLDYLNDEDKVAQTQTIRILKQTWKGYQFETKEKNFKGPAPQDWIIDAENDLALKKAKMDSLQKDYDRLKGGVDADQLAVQEARLNAAKAAVASFSVIAPFDGVVADLKGKLGNSINPGASAVTIADFSHWIVKTTDLTEIDVVNLKEGDPVIVTLDAIPDAELKGTIQSIGQTFSENQGDVVYEVTVMLTDTHASMRWGMTAEVKFEQDNK